MYKWLLIISITLVSTTMLMFLSAFFAILPEASKYYNVDRSKILLLSNSFNIFYLIISPLIFSILKRQYIPLVVVSIVMTAIGCVGRFLAGNNYTIALVMSIVVAVAHVPIITAPYGLLGLFQQSQQGYASSIPLFVPILGINFCILYGMSYIASDQVKQPLEVTKFYIENLNQIIAVAGLASMVATLIFLAKMSRQIKELNQEPEEIKNQKKSICQAIADDFKGGKEFFVLLFTWGIILGLNWTYGGMFGVFLNGTGLSGKDIALVGLCANLSSALFSNLGTWISNKFHYSNSSIIFFLNICGFFGSLFIQASVSVEYPFLQNKWNIIIAIIILRAGFSSFVSLALVELGQYGISTVLVSSVFFYIANGTNLFGIYLVDLLDNSQSLAIMSTIIWFCILFAHIAQSKKPAIEIQTIQMSEQSTAKSDNMMVEIESDPPKTQNQSTKPVDV